MRYLITRSLTVFTMLLGMTAAGMALPSCVGSYSVMNWKNCYGTYTWASGSKYVGEYKDGERHGQGTYTYANGEKYIGEYKNNKKNGLGIYSYPSGGKHVGKYKDGSRHGQGTYTYPSGAKYIGEYKNNKINGQGTFHFANGDKYVGEWKNDKRHGQGTYTYPSGAEYVGEYKNGKRHGQGTYTNPSGAKYVGEYKNSKLNGYAIQYNPDGNVVREGIFEDGKFMYARKSPPCPSSGYFHNCFGSYTFANGDKYVGEWKNDKRHGQGTDIFANGDKYVGGFKDDESHGQGSYTYANGDKYVGGHKDGEKHGQGATTWSDGEKYVGEYKEGKKHGQGTYTYANGDKYIGDYKTGKPHGQGKYFYLADNQFKGYIHVGEYKNGKRNGQGTFTYPNGDKYVGEYKDDKKHGQGTYTFDSGAKEVGEYKNGKLNGYAIQYNPDGSVDQEGIFEDGNFLYTRKISPCPSSGYFHNCFGTYIFDNGDKYVGEHKNNKMHGRGTYTYAASGYIYVGEYKDDNKHGKGTFTWTDGEKYVGEWKDGKRNGLGTYSYPNGDKHVGEYRENKRHGQGTFTFASGNEYVGEYRENKKHGQGAFFWIDGEKYVGEWKDGKRHGQGTYNYPNGNEYVGEYRENKRHGQGTFTYANGSKKEGIWAKGAFQYTKKGTSNNTQTATVTCKDDPTFCTVAQLCTKASHYSGGKKEWRKDYSSNKYVTEAKKNGVSCGVQIVAKKKKPVDNKTYKVASGTGFYVSNSGHIITNHHLIDGCKDMKVISHGRKIETLLLANDPLNDLALLKTKEASKTYFSITNKQPEELQNVIVAGFPFGDKFSSSIKFTQGIVSSLTGIGDNYSQIQIDAALQPGNSGGPIMDNMGNVIGVAVAKLSLKKIMDDYGVVPENTNFGIKASAVRNLMVGNSIIIKEPSGDSITKSQLVKLAKEGTVHLTCWMTVAQIEKALKNETGKVLFKEFEN